MTSLVSSRVARRHTGSLDAAQVAAAYADGWRVWAFHRPGVRAGSAATWSVIVALVALAASVGVAGELARGQRDAARQQLDRRANLVAEAVTSETARYVDTLRTIASATGAFENLTARKFAQVVAPLQQMQLAGATSIVYLVPATAAELAPVQALWRSRGVPSLTLAPTGNAREHIYLIFSVPLDGADKARYGLDLSQAAAPTQALTAARRTAAVAISPAYHLIIDQDLPPERQQSSFILTAPVFGAANGQGRRAFHGWVLMGLRGQDFVGSTLAQVSQNLLDVDLWANNVDGTDVRAAQQRAPVDGRRDLHRQVEVAVADRRWRLRVQAPGKRLLGANSTTPVVVGWSGGVLGVLLAGLVWVLATGRARAKAQVQVAIADLAAAEADARGKAELLAAVLDSISDGVGVVDANGAFLLHNPAAKDLLGVADRDGPQNWQEHYGIYRPDGKTPFPSEELPLARALAGESTEQVEMVIRNASCPDGVVITVSGRPLRTAGQSGAVAVFHDITARKAAEEQVRAARDELAEQKVYLHQVLDAIDVTVLACDTQGRIVQANRTARHTFGNGADNRHVSATIDAADVRTADGVALPLEDIPLMRALRGELVHGVELIVSLADGSRRRVMVHARPLHDAVGRPIGAVASSFDVTELREREADLRAFAGVAAHDLRGPLTAMAGYTELLAEDLERGAAAETLRPTVTRMAGGIDRMVKLVDDLLTYATARDGPLRSEPVDLHTLVEDVVAERTAHLGGAFGDSGTGRRPATKPAILTGTLPIAHGDAGMLRQLLDNLIGNSLKFTRPGQPATIDISAEPAGDGWTRVQVADRGIGIPRDDQPHVFTSFHRAAAHTGYSGTGLGLAICHRIVDRHGGCITATDNPGGGTRIHFTLPTRPG